MFHQCNDHEGYIFDDVVHWLVLFVNTVFFWPRTCRRPRKIVLGLRDLSLASALASRICPRLTSLHITFFPWNIRPCDAAFCLNSLTICCFSRDSEEIMFSPALVCGRVCVSVCLWPWWLKHCGRICTKFYAKVSRGKGRPSSYLVKIGRGMRK